MHIRAEEEERHTKAEWERGGDVWLVSGNNEVRIRMTWPVVADHKLDALRGNRFYRKHGALDCRVDRVLHQRRVIVAVVEVEDFEIHVGADGDRGGGRVAYGEAGPIPADLRAEDGNGYRVVLFNVARRGRRRHCLHSKHCGDR